MIVGVVDHSLENHLRRYGSRNGKGDRVGEETSPRLDPGCGVRAGTDDSTGALVQFRLGEDVASWSLR
ncbi:hypothetical protein [Geotalea toluenoxydans]|uniref:hypothetical protein n=1 Tax=Geotalea toluenoxydans TaxID=421624 RepID=UPI001FB440C6|nr:hypothetical protein [Geotalea toluenoxydans]